MTHTDDLPSVFAPFSTSTLEGHPPPSIPSMTRADPLCYSSLPCSIQETYISTNPSPVERFDLGGKGRKAWYKPNETTIFPRKKEDVLKDLEAKQSSNPSLYQRHSTIGDDRGRQSRDFGWEKFGVGSERVADFGFHEGPTDKYDIGRCISLGDAELSSTSGVAAETDGQATTNPGETSGLSSEADSAVAVAITVVLGEEGVRRMEGVVPATGFGLGTAVSTLWRALARVAMAAVPGRVSVRGFSGPEVEHVDFTDEGGISNDHDEQLFRSHSGTLPPCNEAVDGVNQVDASEMLGVALAVKQSHKQTETTGGNTSLVSAVTEEWVTDQRRLVEMERETDEQGYQEPVTDETFGCSLPSLVELFVAIEDPEMRRLSAMAYLA
ncbi:hypothetical protein FRC16_010514 [Serendipita sp. 398]|nr:hypothetical protein FRC16_010514 [Serendipita sp. 398]